MRIQTRTLGTFDEPRLAEEAGEASRRPWIDSKIECLAPQTSDEQRANVLPPRRGEQRSARTDRGRSTHP